MQQRIINGILVTTEQQELICCGCWRKLKGHYWSLLNDKKVTIHVCITCYKLIMTLWRLEKIGVLSDKDWKYIEIKENA